MNIADQIKNVLCHAEDERSRGTTSVRHPAGRPRRAVSGAPVNAYCACFGMPLGRVLGIPLFTALHQTGSSLQKRWELTYLRRRVHHMDRFNASKLLSDKAFPVTFNTIKLLIAKVKHNMRSFYSFF